MMRHPGNKLSFLPFGPFACQPREKQQHKIDHTQRVMWSPSSLENRTQQRFTTTRSLPGHNAPLALAFEPTQSHPQSVSVGRTLRGEWIVCLNVFHLLKSTGKKAYVQ